MIIDSTISGDHALAGGGIYNDAGATKTINNSTFMRNAASYGGAILNNFTGQFGTIFVNNSTSIANNSFGEINNGGKMTINNSTLSGSGFGIDFVNSGAATFQNTIVAHNSEACSDNPVTSAGYTLSSDNTCNFDGPCDLNNTDPKTRTSGELWRTDKGHPAA